MDVNSTRCLTPDTTVPVKMKRNRWFNQKMVYCGICMKLSLFLVNSIIFIGGLLALGIGIWIAEDRSYMTKLFDTSNLLAAVYITILAGIFMLIIPFLGCVGVAKERRCMLLMYIGIVFVIFVATLVAGILGYMFHEKPSITMSGEMMTTLKLYEHNAAITKVWDKAQRTLHCCGVNGSINWEFRGSKLPQSCCRDPSFEGGCKYKEYEWDAGCQVKMEKVIKDQAFIIGGTASGVAIIMFLVLILSCAVSQLKK